MKERPGKGRLVDIDATIICERDSHKGIIIGKQGAMLKKIGSTARYELEKMLDAKVNLKLWVKVKKDWRDSCLLYTSQWTKGAEPYYPVNDPKNNEIFEKYERRALEEKKVLFGGRLGMYRYMDMDRVIEEALNLADNELSYYNEEQ